MSDLPKIDFDMPIEFVDPNYGSRPMYGFTDNIGLHHISYVTGNALSSVRVNNYGIGWDVFRHIIRNVDFMPAKQDQLLLSTKYDNIIDYINFCIKSSDPRGKLSLFHTHAFGTNARSAEYLAGAYLNMLNTIIGVFGIDKTLETLTTVRDRDLIEKDPINHLGLLIEAYNKLTTEEQHKIADILKLIF